MQEILSLIRLTPGAAPIYRQIADSFVSRIEQGYLRPGDRLPRQRDIAAVLNINLATVTRAFAALQETGLVESRPRRGTIVVQPSQAEGARTTARDVHTPIDLTLSRPATGAYLKAMAGLLGGLKDDPRFAATQDYQPAGGPRWARQAVASWLSPIVGREDPGRIMLTHGAQQALNCVLDAVTRNGDLILTDTVTFQGMNALARARRLEIQGLAIDADGMMPDVFEQVCRSRRPRAVFLVPTFHNPTGITLSAARRRALADVARRYGVLIVEDGVCDVLADAGLPSLTSLAPELTVYISSLSKCVAPGLRCGFILAPQPLVDDIAASLRFNCGGLNPLTALAVTTLLENGSMAGIVREQKQELQARHAIFQTYLAWSGLRRDPNCPHVWLSLPPPWRPSTIMEVARKQGVLCLPADVFAVGDGAVPNAVRLNLSAARSRADLAVALDVLSRLLGSPHGDVPAFI